jgi:hypothetical protein
MTVATDLLDRLAAVGAMVEVTGSHLVVRAGAKPVPRDLVQRLREAKAEVLSALAPAAPEAEWWRCQFAVRTIDRGLNGTRSTAEAARLAWGELECRWHRLHGAHVLEWECAGCGEPIGGLSALHLSDGSRVHFDKIDCLIRYGARWRGAARCALVAMGLHPPAGEDVP